METREIIMNHYTSSPYKIKKEDIKDYQKISVQSDSCIDHLDIFVKIEEDKIVDAYFEGEACAIATSSCSILLKNCINRNFTEIQEFITNFENMINDCPYNEKQLDEAIVFREIIRQGNRKACAYLPYKGLKQILGKEL